ncbi:MAG: TonB-dependent receptor, partial [Bacteroidota bacterium]|nr:TonB-dependent receptor [Bacteroidota bacterium]
KKEVHVIKPYKPTISDAFKINSLPKIIDTVKTIPTFKYYLITKPLDISFKPKIINPAKMVGEPLTKLYNSYTKIAIGNNAMPFIEFYLNNKRSKDFSIGTYFKHLSSFSKVKLANNKKGESAFSDNEILFYGKKFFDNSVLKSNLGFNRNVRHYYGYNTLLDTSFTKDDIKQKFVDFNINTRYHSVYSDSSHINYDFGIKYNYFADDFSNSESAIRFNGKLNKYFDKEMLGVDFDYQNYSKSNSIDSVSNSIFSFSPWLGMYSDKWRVSVGINIYSDKHGESRNTYYYPKGTFEYDIINHYIIPYAGIDGRMEANNYRKIANENPFIIPGLHVENTDNKMILYAGIKGNFSSSLFYNFRLEHSIIENLPFYVNNFSQTDSTGNMFDVVYDDIELTKYFGELSFSPSNDLSFHIKASYSSYAMNNEKEPWHKPLLNINFFTRYDLRNKIILKSDIFVKGKRYALVNNNTIELDPVLDVNLAIEYRYTKILSGFIQLNNILSSDNYMFNYYPTYGFNIMAGITYSF